eukprot:3193177-Prymnesium_polylepis.1
MGPDEDRTRTLNMSSASRGLLTDFSTFGRCARLMRHGAGYRVPSTVPRPARASAERRRRRAQFFRFSN